VKPLSNQPEVCQPRLRPVAAAARQPGLLLAAATDVLRHRSAPAAGCWRRCRLDAGAAASSGGCAAGTAELGASAAVLDECETQLLCGSCSDATLPPLLLTPSSSCTDVKHCKVRCRTLPLHSAESFHHGFGSWRAAPTAMAAPPAAGPMRWAASAAWRRCLVAAGLLRRSLGCLLSRACSRAADSCP
jgi:hypothetical protein